MWSKLTFDDLRTISHYLGVLVLFSALQFVLPLLVGALFGEWEAVSRYLLAAGITLVAGGLMRFARVEPARLNSQQALVVTGLAWIVLAFFATIPLASSGHYATYSDALFDAVSGLTTTGASVIQDLDHLSYADNMFRFMMHLLGGLGLVVVALSFGLFGKGGAAGLYSSEGRSEHVVPNIVQTARFIAKIAVGFILVATAVLTVILCVAGMYPTRALLNGFWLAISGFITGGFTPMSQSVMYYHSEALEMVLMVVMLFGSVNFALYGELFHGRVKEFFQDLEIRTMGVWLLAVTFVFAASLSASTTFSNLPAMLQRGAFLIISAFTTTGFQTITTNEFTTVLTSGAFLVIALVMAVGGSAGGTSGGIKLHRMGIVAKSIGSTVKKAVMPESAQVVVTYEHVGRRIVSASVAQEATTVFILYIITYAIGALAGIAYGYEATQAVFEAVAMGSNGGLTSGIVTAGMPFGLQMVYIFEMWAGRLEFITLLALIVKVVVSLDPRGWNRRKS